MNNISSKLFFCYAWEDSHYIQKFVSQLRYETGSEIVPFSEEENLETIEEKVFPCIDQALVILVFVSDNSKQSEFVRQSAVYARNSDKRVISILIGKNSLFISTPDELKFRNKPVDLKNEKERAILFGQLRSLLGTETEGGDNFGAKVHITCTENVKILRYGKTIGVARVGEDNVLRLVKGEHLLDFYTINKPFRSISLPVVIKNNEGEQYLSIDIQKELDRIKKEKARKDLFKSILAVFLLLVVLVAGYSIYQRVTTHIQTYKLSIPGENTSTERIVSDNTLEDEEKAFLSSFFNNYESSVDIEEYLRSHCTDRLMNSLEDEMEYDTDIIGNLTFRSCYENLDKSATWNGIKYIISEGDGCFLVASYSRGYLIKVRVHVVDKGGRFRIDEANKIFDEEVDGRAEIAQENWEKELDKYISTHNSNSAITLKGTIWKDGGHNIPIIMILTQSDKLLTGCSIFIQDEEDDVVLLSGSWEENGYNLYNDNIKILINLEINDWSSELPIRYAGTFESSEGKFKVTLELP